MLPISIPSPCHENWAGMEPNEKGRHCHACVKTVVDFTNMPDDEVLHYLNNQKGKVCGRFTDSQLSRKTIVLPADIYHIPMPLWKRFLAAGLIAFSAMLFSCDTHTTGMVINNNGVKSNADTASKVCSKENYLLGDIVAEPVVKDTALPVKSHPIQPDMPEVIGIITMPVYEDTTVPVNTGKPLPKEGK